MNDDDDVNGEVWWLILWWCDTDDADDDNRSGNGRTTRRRNNSLIGSSSYGWFVVVGSISWTLRVVVIWVGDVWMKTTGGIGGKCVCLFVWVVRINQSYSNFNQWMNQWMNEFNKVKSRWMYCLYEDIFFLDCMGGWQFASIQSFNHTLIIITHTTTTTYRRRMVWFILCDVIVIQGLDFILEWHTRD